MSADWVRPSASALLAAARAERPLDPAASVTVPLTRPQVQALYLTLFHGRVGGAQRPETRPAYGWMEQPLCEVEAALAPAHRAIHDGDFSALFSNDNSRSFNMPRINLGDEARDTVTGFTGICVVRSDYISGCSRISLQPSVKDDGTIPEQGHFDEPMCEVVRTAAVPAKPSDNGGPGKPVPRAALAPR